MGQQPIDEVWRDCPEDSILAALARCVSAIPWKTFLKASGRSLTYAETDSLTNRLGRGLIQLGVRPGDRIASLLENGLEPYLVWIAANKAGAIHVPLNIGLDERALRDQLANCAPRVVITEATYADAARQMFRELGEEPAVVLRSDLDRHLATNPTAPPMPHDVFDLSSIVYTSGTTGLPKGCMISHNYHCNMARLLIVARGRRPDDVVWTAQPNFHLEAMSTAVVQTLLLGGTACVALRFEIEDFWSDMERSAATVAVMMYGSASVQALAERPSEPASASCRGRLRQVVCPASPEIALAWRRRFGVPEVGINRGYGSTEASMVTITPHRETPPAGASGHRIPMFDVRIVDERDRELPVGETGEIVWRPLRPGVMFDGYWNRPEATLAASRNWWFHGGDLGRLDDEGWLYYSGRKTDLIVAGRRPLTMFDAEMLLLRHPAVLEAAVHWVNEGRSELKASVVLKPGTRLAAAELYEFAQANLPAPAVPLHIEFRPALPKNATGRVLKGRLLAEGLGPETWSAPN